MATEKALVDSYVKARQKKAAHGVWQTLGAFADSYLTGASPQAARQARAMPDDTVSESEKIKMLQKPTEAYESAERQYAIEDVKAQIQREKMALQRLIAALDDATRNRRISVDASYKRSMASAKQAAAATDRAYAELERMTTLDKDEAAILDQALRPGPAATRKAEALLIKAHGIKPDAATGDLTYPNGEPLTDRDIAELRNDAEEAAANIVQGRPPAGLENDPLVSEIVQDYRSEKVPVLEEYLRNKPGAEPGSRVKVLDAAALTMNIPADRLLNMMRDPELIASTAQDRQMRDGQIAANTADMRREVVAAEQAARSVGGNSAAVNAARDQLTRATREVEGLGQRLQQITAPSDVTPPGAPPPGGLSGPPGLGGASAPRGPSYPSGSGSSTTQGTYPLAGSPAPQQQTAEWDMSDPVHRNWAAMGNKTPPPSNGMEYLSQMMQRIEELPSVPAVQRTKQAIQDSPQYQQWLANKRYHPNDQAFNWFVKEVRDKQRQAERENAMRRRAEKGKPFTATPQDMEPRKPKPLTTPPPVQGFDTGSKEE